MRPLPSLLSLALVLATAIAVPAVLALLLATAVALPATVWWPRAAIVQPAAPLPALPGATAPIAQSVAPTAFPPVQQPAGKDSAIAPTDAEVRANPRSIEARIVEGSLSDPTTWGFDPRQLTVRVGDTVTWTNTGALPHTITAENDAFDSDMVAAGAQWSFTPTTAGTFNYLCALHPTMSGVLVVEAGPPPAASSASTPIAPTATPKTVPAASTSPTATAVPQSPVTALRPSPPGGRQSGVQIVSDGFNPSTVNAAVGDTVTWTNSDRRRHTVTASDGTFDSGTLNSGARWSFAVTREGTFAYVCAFHPEMQGTLVVASFADSAAAGAPSLPASPVNGDPVPQPSTATPSKVEIDLVGGGSFAAASGDARFESDRGRRKLRVEVEDAATAVGDTLDVFVGGAKVGSMTVTSKGEAELELDTNKGAASIPAAVAGQRVEARTADGTVVVTGQFP